MVARYGEFPTFPCLRAILQIPERRPFSFSFVAATADDDRSGLLLVCLSVYLSISFQPDLNRL